MIFKFCISIYNLAINLYKTSLDTSVAGQILYILYILMVKNSKQLTDKLYQEVRYIMAQLKTCKKLKSVYIDN